MASGSPERLGATAPSDGSSGDSEAHPDAPSPAEPPDPSVAFAASFEALLASLAAPRRAPLAALFHSCAPELVDFERRRRLLRSVDACCALLAHADDAEDVVMHVASPHLPKPPATSPPISSSPISSPPVSSPPISAPPISPPPDSSPPISAPPISPPPDSSPPVSSLPISSPPESSLPISSPPESSPPISSLPDSSPPAASPQLAPETADGAPESPSAAAAPAAAPPPATAASPPPLRHKPTKEHLLFLVHGIGQHDDFIDGAFLNWDGTEGMTGGNHEFRELLEGLVHAKFREVRMPLAVCSIEWHSKLHSTGVDDVLDACDPGGVQGLRSFIKGTMMDALSYTGGGNGQRVIDTIVAQLTAKYHAYKEDHPRADVAVSIFAHSLGSVISYDLLTHEGRTFQGINYPKLPFHVDNFFACGSPVAAFLLARKQAGLEHTPPHTPPPTPASPPSVARAPRPRCGAYFNIYSGVDPIAWLVAPVVASPADAPPAAPPPHAAARPVAHEQMKLLPPAKALPAQPSWGEVVRHLRSHDRRGETDQQVKSSGWVVSDVLNARNAHSCYWLSEDVAFFVLTQLLAPWAQSIPEPIDQHVDARAQAAYDLGPDLFTPLELLSNARECSQITGLQTPVVALLQRSAAGVRGAKAALHLYLYSHDARALPDLRGEIPLKGSLLSTPVSSGRKTKNVRIHVQVMGADGPGRLYELSAADYEDAAGWMAAMSQRVASVKLSEAEEPAADAEERRPSCSGRPSACSTDARPSADESAAEAAEEGARWGDAHFFGASRVGLLQKRGEGTMSRWHWRWFALAGERLLYYDRAPKLGKPRVALDVSSARLRLYAASLTMAWDVSEGRVHWLRADSIDSLRKWQSACHGLGIRTEWREAAPAMDSLLQALLENDDQLPAVGEELAREATPPAALTLIDASASWRSGRHRRAASDETGSSASWPSGKHRRAPSDGHSDGRARWRVSVSSYRVLQDDKGSFASFTVHAMRNGESFVSSRRYTEFVALHKQLHRRVAVTSLLPPLPPTRYFARLDPQYLLAKQAKMQEYLQALVALGPSSTHCCGEAGNTSSALISTVQAGLPRQAEHLKAPPEILRAIQEIVNAFLVGDLHREEAMDRRLSHS
ncbi:hypothetical protein AB1Y20_000690 [Prymnesium parvum]|uniref:Uncharacterized protein n=1 Tax=Prymnesium parvum TaxID=97485 RepID=A0AB34K5J0_PRYPA